MRIIPELKITLGEIASLFELSEVKNVNAEVSAFTTDSREVKEGDVFVALKGERRSGEDYISEARAKGAYIISSESQRANFKVENTYHALLRIASFYKGKLKKLKSTVGITGSVGKTTAKNIVAKMLSQKYQVHATEKNYNNFLGLSHTILTAPSDTEIIVAEIGMNHLGEIEMLSRALRPNISVITNIGTAHVGMLGNRKRIAEAKLEILKGMSVPTVIVPYEEILLKDAPGSYTYSTENKSADCFILPKEELSSGSKFEVRTGKWSIPENSTVLPGRHILSSIAIGVSVMDILDYSMSDVRGALTMLSPDLIRAKEYDIGKISVYDDTYSSSPEAIIAVFKLLALDKSRTRSCVLGDMLELGEHSEQLHCKIGEAVHSYGFSRLYTFGKLAQKIADAAKRSGMKPENIFTNCDLSAPEITAEQIFKSCEAGEIILFKASHEIDAGRICECLKRKMK